MEEGLSCTLAQLAAFAYRLSGDWSDWRPLLARVSAHVAVLTVTLLGTVLSSVEWQGRVAAPMSVSAALSAAGRDGQVSVGEPLADATSLSPDRLATSSGPSGAISRQPSPHTIIPERPRLSVITYTVEAGDTIQSIAKHFGLEPTTVMWANPAVEDAPDLLRIGQELAILPIDGVYHQVEEGDTLASIAEAYEVEPQEIVDCQYNDLEGVGSGIDPGSYLIVPGGEKPYEPKIVTAYTGPVPEGARGTGRFQWPVLGRITQGHWYGHRAIDIGAPTGSAVMATDGGFVSFAGWTDVGYGYLIVVDHANGFATYYAHLSNIYVAEGQAVKRGQVIGAVGNTGDSTGPHLHFEVRRYNRQQNPRAYLP
ncbi:MAG: peptidoglycan DD-metalloendopeptidase family protein [Anaerolineae bacterium]